MSYLYHESIERMKNKNSIGDIIFKMLHKYNPNQVKTKSKSIHICAFIHNNSNKIFYGENSLRSFSNIPISTHAEIDVLRKINKVSFKLKDNHSFDIIVIKISPTNGKLGSSRPCYHCIKKLLNNNYDLKIRYVYYSTSEGYINKEKLKDMLYSDKTVISKGWMKTYKN